MTKPHTIQFVHARQPVYASKQNEMIREINRLSQSHGSYGVNIGSGYYTSFRERSYFIKATLVEDLESEGKAQALMQYFNRNTETWSGEMYVVDTFTGTDGTDLESHAMNSGNGWTATDWEINDNQARYTIAGTSLAITSTLYADVTISVTATIGDPTGDSSAGIVLRYTDPSNYWLITLNQTSGQLQIVKVDSGTPTVMMFVAVPIVTGETYSLTAAADGDVIQASGGGGWLEYTDAFNNTATMHGLLAVQEVSVTTPHTFDNFRIGSGDLLDSPAVTVYEGLGLDDPLPAGTPVYCTWHRQGGIWLVTAAPC